LIYRTIGAREVRKQGIFSPDFPDGPALRWYRARFCLSRQLFIPHSLDARDFAASIVLITGFDSGNSLLCRASAS